MRNACWALALGCSPTPAAITPISAKTMLEKIDKPVKGFVMEQVAQ